MWHGQSKYKRLNPSEKLSDESPDTDEGGPSQACSAISTTWYDVCATSEAARRRHTSVDIEPSEAYQAHVIRPRKVKIERKVVRSRSCWDSSWLTRVCCRFSEGKSAIYQSLPMDEIKAKSGKAAEKRSDERVGKNVENEVVISYFNLAVGSYRTIIVDILVHVALLCAYLWARKQPSFKRNIHFNDWELYMNPYADNPRVPGTELYIITWVLPCVILFLCFIYQLFHYKRSTKFNSYLTNGIIPAHWFAFADFLDGLMQYTLAVLFTSFTVQFIKMLAGVPRPDMFNRCWPSKWPMNMNGEYPNIMQTLAFRKSLPLQPELFKCDDTARGMESAFKSFPSGHSGYSMAGCLSAALYLCGKFNSFSKRGRLSSIKLLLPLSIVYISIYTGLTRIEDYRHHPADVLVGWLIGAIFAYTTYIIYFPAITSTKSKYSYRQLAILEKIADS